jgi:hypothetical protein
MPYSKGGSRRRTLRARFRVSCAWRHNQSYGTCSNARVCVRWGGDAPATFKRQVHSNIQRQARSIRKWCRRFKSRIANRESRIAHHASRITHHASRITSHKPRIMHHASRIIRCPEDQTSRRPEDQRTRRPEDQDTRGPEDQRTRGPEDQRTKVPEDRRTERGRSWQINNSQPHAQVDPFRGVGADVEHPRASLSRAAGWLVLSGWC